jgi:hypothetical protein
MRHFAGVALTLWAVFTPFTMADDIVYVTDMDVFPFLVRTLNPRISSPPHQARGSETSICTYIS